MRHLLSLCYQLAMAAALLVVGPFLLLRRGRHYLATLRGRLGGHESDRDGRRPVRAALWLHAVSVGEAGVAATLAAALPGQLPLLVTTVTPTGQQRARSSFASRIESGGAAVAYLPFDLGFAVRRFFDRFRPAALVLVEGDLWPLVLATARRRGLPVAVVNGRVSDRTFPRLRRAGAAARWLFGQVDRFGVQSDQDRQRLLALGVAAERVTVTGNLKYDTPEPALDPALAAAVEALAGGRPIVVAGSTMRGEEEAVAEALAELGADRALAVIAPRHPERWDEAARVIEESGLSLVRRSRLDLDAAASAAAARPAVLLLDSLGELAGIYRLAAAAFIGGTLAPTGGHNPLEPARFGVATAVGPSMENFRDMARRFDDDGAWARVADAGQLAVSWRRWLDDPATAAAVGERGRQLVEANRGATGRTVELLAPLLERVERARRPADGAASADGGRHENNDGPAEGAAR